MTRRQEQWSKVKTIFDAAAALDAPARTAYLDHACGADRALREQVERLLRSHDEAPDFLESPAAAAVRLPDPADQLIGRTIGPYRVESRLGSGGMGDVYKAHDTRLDRPVALKLLSSRFAADAERLRRFHAEVRAASSLNHPHILVLHDLGEVDGRPFMVTEFVEGQTLRQRLQAGPLLLRETIEIASQIASALSAAHSRAIVHRDIKPENIMVRPDGYVKVLDFGLAKLASSGVPDEGATGTSPGMVVGTPQYMSPEQARGHDVDFRSDQFSLGVVMYELATGRSPFARASAVETAAAVITDQPEPILRFRPETPSPLVWAIERCLAKNRDRRYSSTADLDRDLASMHEGIAEVRPDVPFGAPSNLPVIGTPFVGRDADVESIGALLRQDDIRWVTLTGPGGVGKTRLAIEVAEGLAKEFGGAVYFVPLASISDPTLVPSAIAGVLGVRVLAGEGPLSALKRHFAAAPRTLLVIDNFEQVADAAPTVAELFASTRGLTVLATSRAGLHVAEEHEYQVATLALPAPDRGRQVTDLAHVPAVALFVERARAARADFVLTAENAKAVADICTTLDGLPLAIELAAARVKVLPPIALLAHLEGKRLSLAGGARNLPARQQTLRQTIDWGYGLLAPAEQRLFRRLAVFAGGWTLEAAEAVCDARQDLGLDVFEGISSLVDKSLVRPADTSGSEARFAMLGTIREYGTERLAAAGELEGCRQAHAAFCLVLAEEGATTDAAEHIRWLELCHREHANLLAAIEFLIDSRQSEWALRLCAALLPFWQGRAHFAEAIDRLTRAIRLDEAGPATETRTRAMLALGTLWSTTGEHDRAAATLLEVLAAFRALGDERGTAVALNAVAASYYVAQRVDQAEPLCLEALAIFRSLGDGQAVARTLSNLAGMALERGDIERAAALLKDVRDTCARLGDTAGEAWSLNFQAQVEWRREDRDAARRLYSEALTRFRIIRDSWGLGDSLLALGHLACESSDAIESRRRFEEAHGVFNEVADIRGLVRVIEGFARLAAETNDALRALKLAGAAAALRQRIGAPLPKHERHTLERALDRVRQDPNAHGVGSAWMDGWSMTTEEAVSYALAPG